MPPTEPQNRAGGYYLHITGYRAFIPNPLPPNPPIQIEGEIQALLSQADRALGRLDGSILTLPNPDLFVFMYVRKEAVFPVRSKVLKVPSRIFWPPRRKFSLWTAPRM
jgi:hypothetical protein